LIGAALFSAPFKIYAYPHPQEDIEFNEYRIREFFVGHKERLFTDRQALSPSDLIYGLEIVCQFLIDYEMYEKVLPLATLMDFVSTDLTKSTHYMIKARIFKSLVQCRLGYIHQSMQSFYSIIEHADNINHISRQKQMIMSSQEEEPANPDTKEIKYRNDLPPYSEENTKAIEYLISIETDQHEFYKISPGLNEEIKFLK
jgi:hypothetical protein